MKYKLPNFVSLIVAVSGISAVLLACRTTGNVSTIRAADTSSVEATGRAIYCFGSRRIDSGMGAFDFHAQHLNLFNSYWLGQMSIMAYENNALTDSVLTQLASMAKPKIIHLNSGSSAAPNAAESRGFIADFGGGTVISIHGTDSFDDVLTDLNQTMLPTRAINREGQIANSFVHTGFENILDLYFEPIILPHLLASPVIQLDPAADATFQFVNAVFRGVLQEADIEDLNPDKYFRPKISELKRLGITKTEADEEVLLEVLNIWAEEYRNVAIVTPDNFATADLTAYNRTFAAGNARKRHNLARVASMFNFRNYPPLWLTGHSSGAAFSTLLAERLYRLGIPVQGLVTFGSPRASNDVESVFLESAMRDDGTAANINRFVNFNDSVARVPSGGGGWDHVGKPFYFDAAANLYVPITEANELSALKNQQQKLAKGTAVQVYQTALPAGFADILQLDFTRGLADHSLLRYVPQIEAIVYGGKPTGCP